MTRKTAVANDKGGVGKSTSAANLMAGLAEKGEIVLGIDMDRQSGLASYFNITKEVEEEGKCISNLFKGAATVRAVMNKVGGRKKAEEMLVSLFANNAVIMRDHTPSRPNLVILPATNKINHVLRQLIIDDYSASRSWDGPSDHVPLNDILTFLLTPIIKRFGFTYVVIDCPPNLGEFTPAVYRFVDYALVPTKADKLSLIDTVAYTKRLANLLEHPDPNIRANAKIAYVLPTMVDERQRLARSVLGVLNQVYVQSNSGTGVLAPIPESVFVKEAANTGQTVMEYAPESAPAVAYEKAIEAVMRLK